MDVSGEVNVNKVVQQAALDAKIAENFDENFTAVKFNKNWKLLTVRCDFEGIYLNSWIYAV